MTPRDKAKNILSHSLVAWKIAPIIGQEVKPSLDFAEEIITSIELQAYSIQWAEWGAIIKNKGMTK